MIKAVIYDFDDTIVDSQPVHSHAWDIALREYNCSFKNFPELLRENLKGKRGKESTKVIIDYFRLNIDIDSLFGKKREIFMELIKEELQLLPGVKDSLLLIKKNNMKIAIGTSAIKHYLYFAL